MGDSDDITTVRVRLPDEVLATLDELIRRGLFSNRSEAIREFTRQYVMEARHG